MVSVINVKKNRNCSWDFFERVNIDIYFNRLHHFKHKIRIFNFVYSFFSIFQLVKPIGARRKKRKLGEKKTQIQHFVVNFFKQLISSKTYKNKTKQNKKIIWLGTGNNVNGIYYTSFYIFRMLRLMRV